MPDFILKGPGVELPFITCPLLPSTGGCQAEFKATTTHSKRFHNSADAQLMSSFAIGNPALLAIPAKCLRDIKVGDHHQQHGE
jgi:hypothetical protein